ncbi:serine hydrolase domain-containing protein [Agromyces archimandritae]|uniref:Beta-lactamase family protein n=1 Tax=Agromyces archimandritae TaxID=2781962 RepID=A0A975FQ31_9MICO|nr:serine hydrolase domain-containing protein [Agromyces archimandritae]QTX05924.1 beta-lactamase family protein [Agromyces archimandritae]
MEDSLGRFAPYGDAAGPHPDAALAAILARHGVPGAQIVHSRPGSTDAFAFGVRDAGTGDPVTPRTRFEAASLTKVVAAYLVLRRVDAGRLDLDETLHSRHPSPRTDARARRITARHVLAHTTGLPDWAGDPGSDEAPLTPAWEPGERFGYSGDGFQVLQRTVEAIDGRPFARSLAEEVFGPFGMADTSLVFRLPDAAHLVAGHDRAGRPGIPSRYTRGSIAYTLTTTATDYDRFVRRALLGGEGLSPAAHAAWLAPASDARGWPAAAAADTVSWGLGVGLEHRADGDWAWHWGDNGIRTAFFAASPARGEAVGMFFNSSEGLRAVDAVLHRLLGAPRFAALDWLGLPAAPRP